MVWPVFPCTVLFFFFFSSRRRHTRCSRDWSSDVCSSDLIHLVLLSHMHGDHVGDLKLKAPGEGTCVNSARVPAPNSTTAEVVAGKNAVLVTTRAMASFIQNKVDAI